MSMAYIGTKQCGCTVAAFVDKPEYKNDIAKEVSRWIREGLIVTRVNVEDVNLTSCKCDEEQQPTKCDETQTTLFAT